MSSLPQIMGILNCTPDSFYDGEEMSLSARIEKGRRLLDAGAEIIDVGGESTRPGSAPVTAEQETSRITPVISQLKKITSVPISVDTYRAATAVSALAAGATIINDVRGGEYDGDEKMFRLAAEHSEKISAIVITHCQGEPLTMQRNPIYADVVRDVIDYLNRRRQTAIACGIAAEKIIVDPGFGFGKTGEQNWKLFAALPEISAEFHRQGARVLIGVSNKTMLGGEVNDRVERSVAAAVEAAKAGVDIVRVHNVAETSRALQSLHLSRNEI